MNDITKNTTETTVPDNLSTVPGALVPTEPLSSNYAGQKRLVRDIGARLRDISGLKTTNASIRSPEMTAEILSRLRSGETLLSVTSDPHICGHSTIHDWMDIDADLDAAITRAREVGAQLLYDSRMDVALGGAFSTGDRLRDELVVKVLTDTAAKRNRAVFGDRIQIDATHSIAPVMLPTIALPTIPDAEFDEIPDEETD